MNVIENIIACWLQADMKFNVDRNLFRDFDIDSHKIFGFYDNIQMDIDTGKVKYGPIYDEDFKKVIETIFFE